MLLLSPPSKKEIEWALERELCYRSFSHFVKRFWGTVEPGTPLVWGWAIQAICDHLQAVDEDVFNKLIICLPPGFAKSILVSVMWPAWSWLRRPWIRMLFGSYDENLAFRDSDKCKDVIKSKLYQRLLRPEWRLNKNIDSKSYFANTDHGSRKTFYVGSRKKTGWRGNYLVIDDPLSAEDRYNAPEKAHASESWDRVLSTRVNKLQHHAYVVIMQRLAADDLAGHLIKKYGNEYVQLILANEFNPSKRCVTPIFVDPRTEEGELLSPDLFDREKTESAKNVLREDYLAQYQHDPVPIGGTKFESQNFLYWKWTTHYLVIELMHRDGRTEHVRLDRCEQFLSIDVACGIKKKNDCTSMGRWALTKDCNLVLLDRLKFRKKEGETVDEAKNFFNDKRWGKVPPSAVNVEDNGLGLPIAQHMAAEGLPVNYIHVNQDKEVMAASAAIRMKWGQIFFPEMHTTSWMPEFCEELTMFPGTTHDDDPSMVSIAANSVFEVRHGLKGPALHFPIDKPRFNASHMSSTEGRRDLFGARNGNGNGNGH